MDNILPKLEKELKIEAIGNKEYKIKAIINIIVYG